MMSHSNRNAKRLAPERRKRASGLPAFLLFGRRSNAAMWLLASSLFAAHVSAMAEDGPLRIAMFASFPPMAYQIPETGALVGVDIELADYVGRKLHRPVIWQDVSYEQAIPALTTKRVDLAFSLLDEPASRDKLDFIDYLNSGIQAYTLAKHPPIRELTDLCGVKLGANRRNGFSQIMRDWSSAHCLPINKPPIVVVDTDGTQAARLELQQGRIDAVVQSSESVPYLLDQDPKMYMRIGRPLPGSKIAIAFPKGADRLRDQVSAALRDAVADGTYAKILAKFKVAGNSAAVDIMGKRP
ncbi:transporter substrate-binding domain-containing protein [Burkholderia stagnalis]|uniref:transporter substrate-binding domain-containing protein n=1 Tax=Burkholderia stagnalis TaxID=1503054 RepID=UPI0009BF5E86|nr:transporter substrate-binding domain-containing protein [Burkholderia stagnalis]